MAASCSAYVSDSQLDSPCSTDQETSDSESSSETPVTTASPPTVTTPANTRKRKRKEGGWQKNKRKRLRNTGQEYVTAKGLASRGSNEVASCLMKHLREMNSEADNLVLYSDSCGGQNRNIGMVCTLMYIVASSEFSYKSIDHKFMVSGHSYLPNDRDFSSIETSKRKRSHIYTPQDWYELIRMARRKNPFHVCEMGTMDFVSVNKIKDNITNRKITTNGQKVEWLKMKWIQVTEGDPYQFRSLECWKVVNLKKRAKGRPIAISNIHLPTLYEDGRCINPKKLDDLMCLLQFIPPFYHSFYKHLRASNEDSETEED